MMIGSAMKGSGAAFDVLDIGNPVALPSRKARLFPFTIEAGRRATQERLIDPFERVDADDCVKMAVDPAGDHRHYAAAGAGVELRGPGTERVPGYERGILDHDLQRAAWIGGPCATMLGAKRAGACANRNFGGIRLPGEREGDVPAVALPVDQQACISVVAAPNLRGSSSASEATRGRAPCQQISRARPMIRVCSAEQ